MRDGGDNTSDASDARGERKLETSGEGKPRNEGGEGDETAQVCDQAELELHLGIASQEWREDRGEKTRRRWR
jgi:hypothetical protein